MTATITLTRSLPASPDEFAAFAEAARVLGPASIDHDGSVLIATLGTTTAPATPKPAPAPTPPPARKPQRRPNSPVTGRILDAIEDMGGTWNGSGKELAEHLGIDPRAAAQAITHKAADGTIILTKPHPRKISAITLTTARFPEADDRAPSRISVAELLIARDAAGTSA